MTFGIGYYVDPVTLEGTIQRFVHRQENLRPNTIEAVRDGLEILYQAAQTLVPIGSGAEAGALARSMDRRIHDIRPAAMIVSGKVTMMKDGQQKPYAWMREKGGTILPRPENRLQRLVWTNDKGQVIFARSVTQKGSHYMEGALLQSRSEVRSQFNLMLKKVVKFVEAA